jgi:hypothetical protein
MKILLVFILCSFSFACASLNWKKTNLSNPSNFIKDSSIAFIDYFEATEVAPNPNLEELFRTLVLPQNFDYYEYRLQSLKSASGGIEENLKRQLVEFKSLRKKYESVASQFRVELPPAIFKFKEMFPDFSIANEINIVHSLGELNGGTRQIKGKTRFYIGIDVIAKFHSWQDQTAFFHHELFHLYHMQKNPDVYSSDSVALALWKEGLATWVSKKLNQHASPAELMLEIPPNLYSECLRNKKVLAESLKQDLSKIDLETYKKYFLMSGGSTVIPKRAGYCIGFLAVEDVSKNLSVDQMVNAKPSVIEQLLANSLSRLSDLK